MLYPAELRAQSFILAGPSLIARPHAPALPWIGRTRRGGGYPLKIVFHRSLGHPVADGISVGPPPHLIPLPQLATRLLT